MKKIILSWCICLLCLFGLAGCGPQIQQQDVGATHVVTDGMGQKITLPKEPKRIVVMGAGTIDIVYPMVGPDRIVAITSAPCSIPEAFKTVKGRVSSNAEAVMAYQPDLVLVPSWFSKELVSEMRSIQLPVYTYEAPTTAKGSEQLILQLGQVLGTEPKAKEIVDTMEKRMADLSKFVNAIPKDKRKSVALDTGSGLVGGKDTSFHNLCEHANLIDVVTNAGLNSGSRGNRELLIQTNPDIIILPTSLYDTDKYHSPGAVQYYSDPALQGVSAVKNKQIYVINASWLMTYSQYMVNAMEMMAHDAYGYPVVPPGNE